MLFALFVAGMAALLFLLVPVIFSRPRVSGSNPASRAIEWKRAQRTAPIAAPDFEDRAQDLTAATYPRFELDYESVNDEVEPPEPERPPVFIPTDIAVDEGGNTIDENFTGTGAPASTPR